MRELLFTRCASDKKPEEANVRGGGEERESEVQKCTLWEKKKTNHPLARRRIPVNCIKGELFVPREWPIWKEKRKPQVRNPNHNEKGQRFIR